MISKYSFLFLVFNVFIFCKSAFVDTLTKCHITDGECAKKLIKKVMLDIATTGVPEIGLQAIDPVHFKNVHFNWLDNIDVTLMEGVATGLKDCVIDRFDVQLENKLAFIDVTCDVTVEGKYDVNAENVEALKKLYSGKKIYGNGSGRVKIVKLTLKSEVPFAIQKRDGEIYIKLDLKNNKNEYDVLGKIEFFVENIMVGDVNISTSVVNFLNANWRTLLTTFGKSVMDTAFGYLNEFLGNFFDGVPAKYYIIEDLSAYVQ